MSKNDMHSQLAGNRRVKRQWITWMRMVRYGVNNFTRNIWLTTAATAVMTITLLIIFTAFVSREVLNGAVNDIRSKIDIPVNLKPGLEVDEVMSLKKKFESQSDVKEVRYVSEQESKQNFLNSHTLSAETLSTLAGLPNQPYYAVLRVVVRDPSNTAALEKFVKEDEQVQGDLNTLDVLQPKFSGDKVKQIKTISGWASMAEKGGLIAGAIFVAISMLIIFNTIRMAIFSRKDEIEMMKLVGADKSFIRGPFVVEAVMYGFFAALFAAGIGIALFIAVEPSLSWFGITGIRELSSNLVMYSPAILVVLIFIGSIIGIVSARLAVRRYLRLS